ncbi:MAG: hypothetical protein M3Y19_05760 [Actinomycetota bacterium]|nr:hypothetical protein [Actinomycetota bacterium]
MADGSDPFDFSEFGSPPGGPPSSFAPQPGPGRTGGFGPPPQQPESRAPGPFGQVPQFGVAAPDADPFADDTMSRVPPSVAQVRPPVLWLALGAAVAVVGMVLALVLGTHIFIAVISWVLAGPVAIGLLATFTIVDTGQRARPLYSFPSWLPWAYRGVLVLAVLGVAAGAWRIAEWAGRL